MVHLMLDANGHHILRLDGARLAVQIPNPHMHRLEALDPVVHAWHRQATFFVEFAGFAAPNNLGIHDHQRLVALFGDVHHDQPLMHIHLGGGKTNSAGVVHGFQHIGCQLAQAVIKRADRLRHGVQAGVGVLEDGE